VTGVQTCALPISNAADDPAKCVETFTAQVVILADRPQIKSGIKNGYTPILHCHTCHIATKFKNIDARLDRKTGKVIEVNPEVVRTGDSCIVTLEPTKPMVVEAFADYPSLGRFVVRDNGTTVAVGIIKSVVKKA
jgi:elongation factor 1-alpha